MARLQAVQGLQRSRLHHVSWRRLFGFLLCTYRGSPVILLAGLRCITRYMTETSWDVGLRWSLLRNLPGTQHANEVDLLQIAEQ